MFGPSTSPPRRILLAVLILAIEFGLLEAGLRLWGAGEGSTTFQSLFMDDPAVGHRLAPGAAIRYTTVEFTTDIVVNAQGVRDDEPLGPKAADERRILLLGDSLVLSVQVAFSETFGEHLERRLNASGGPHRWRVINAGVQGYGPVQEWRYFDKFGAAFDPDVVLVIPFVGNDAVEAADTASALAASPAAAEPGPSLARRMRRVVRSSVVLQSVRLRWDFVRGWFSGGAPERPLTSYLADPPPMIQEGLSVTRQSVSLIAERARAQGARTAIALMPARFQTDDGDYGRLAEIVRQAGGELVRNAASERFRDALAPLGLPMIDLQPVLAAEPDRMGLFFQRNVHLTRRGHEVVGRALFEFLSSTGVLRDPAASEAAR